MLTRDLLVIYSKFLKYSCAVTIFEIRFIWEYETVMKVLMVDDEATILLHYKLELEDEGYEVVTASDADEALRLFEKENPDLVTLDVVMPMRAGGRLKPSLEPVGIQILRYMREIDEDVPIIMLSAYDYTDRAAKLKCNGYLTKSADTRPLKKLIREISSNLKDQQK